MWCLKLFVLVHIYFLQNILGKNICFKATRVQEFFIPDLETLTLLNSCLCWSVAGDIPLGLSEQSWCQMAHCVCPSFAHWSNQRPTWSQIPHSSCVSSSVVRELWLFWGQFVGVNVKQGVAEKKYQVWWVKTFSGEEVRSKWFEKKIFGVVRVLLILLHTLFSF